MTYKLNIQKKEKNPEYKPPKNFGEIYRQPYDVHEYDVFDILDVEITEEQWIAIRREVLKLF